MKQSSVRRIWPLAAAALLVISACSSAATAAPPSPAAGGGGAASAPAAAASAPVTASAAPAGQSADKTIYFGSGATPGSPEDYLIPVFTTARDVLKSEGYDLQYTSLATDEVVEAALDRGRVDAALLSMVGLQRAKKAGLHMTWVVTNETQNTFVLVVKSDVTNLTQLKGKKIGTQDPTSLTTAAIPGILGSAGLSPSDYTVVNLAGSANRAAALAAGSMDASMMLYTIAEELIAKTNGKFKVWGGGASPGAPMMWEGLVISDPFRANKAASEAFVSAVLQAYQKFYQGDPATICKDAINRGYNELQGLDAAGCTADLKLYQGEKLFPVDGGVGQSLFDPMITTLVAAGQMKQADEVPYAQSVDPSLVQAANP